VIPSVHGGIGLTDAYVKVDRATKAFSVSHTADATDD